jgi:hypothetical protein
MMPLLVQWQQMTDEEKRVYMRSPQHKLDVLASHIVMGTPTAENMANSTRSPEQQAADWESEKPYRLKQEAELAALLQAEAAK